VRWQAQRDTTLDLLIRNAKKSKAPPWSAHSKFAAQILKKIFSAVNTIGIRLRLGWEWASCGSSALHRPYGRGYLLLVLRTKEFKAVALKSGE
jgi:hypothetical protein